MKKILLVLTMLMAAVTAQAGPLATVFKAADGSVVNFGTARNVARFGTTIYVTDGAGVNNVVGDAAGTLWAKFISWPARTQYYVAQGDQYINVAKAERVGCIGTQSYYQFAGQTYPTYFSDNCLFSNAVNTAALM